MTQSRYIKRRIQVSPDVSAVGRSRFIAEHDLWNDEQREAVSEVKAIVAEEQLHSVRVCYSDQHGLVKSKVLAIEDFQQAMENGHAFNTGPISMDTSSTVFLPIFSEDGGLGGEGLGGGADMLAVPDPTTFRVLPWVEKTGWVQCDLYTTAGRRVPFDTRYIYQQALAALNDAGYQYVAGLEVEFYIFRIEDAKLRLEESGWPPDPPDVTAIGHGYQYMGETHLDEIHEIVEHLRRNLVALGLPLRSIEDEWGPGQTEITFDPEIGIDPADHMLLFRSAVKQICRRLGLLATFMCKPGVPNCFTSGWHLHQSLQSNSDGVNAFTAGNDQELISDVGKHYMGGLLNHANACTAFAIPTINGYKRMNDSALAPNRALWAHQNRAAFLRLIGGGVDPSTHIENRSGDPAANPYLFMASQIYAGLDGLENKTDPGEPRNDEPYAQVDVPHLPVTLTEAITALDQSKLLREQMGDGFVDYYLAMKRFELARFNAFVSDWEHREYLEAF
jgi:glutamine synthetase